MEAVAATILAVGSLDPVHHAPLGYIDPGAGSLIVQALIATVLALPFILRRQVHAAVDRVLRRSSEPEDVDPSDAPPT